MLSRLLGTNLSRATSKINLSSIVKRPPLKVNINTFSSQKTPKETQLLEEREKLENEMKRLEQTRAQHYSSMCKIEVLLKQNASAIQIEREPAKRFHTQEFITKYISNNIYTHLYSNDKSVIRIATNCNEHLHAYFFPHIDFYTRLLNTLGIKCRKISWSMTTVDTLELTLPDQFKNLNKNALDTIVKTLTKEYPKSESEIIVPMLYDALKESYDKSEAHILRGFNLLKEKIYSPLSESNKQSGITQAFIPRNEICTGAICRFQEFIKTNDKSIQLTIRDSLIAAERTQPREIESKHQETSRPRHR